MSVRNSIVAARWLFTSVVSVVGLVLAISGCGVSSSSSTPTTPTPGCTPTPTNPECVNPPNLLTVTILKGVYSPNPVTVKVGQSVNWLNSDPIAHTATDPGVFDTGSIAPTSAADAPVQFNTVGTFAYHCTLHANESASIVVISGSATRTAQLGPGFGRGLWTSWPPSPRRAH